VTFAQRKDFSSAEKGCLGLTPQRSKNFFGQRDAGVTAYHPRSSAGGSVDTKCAVAHETKKPERNSLDADLDSMADFLESTLAGIRMAGQSRAKSSTPFEICRLYVK